MKKFFVIILLLILLLMTPMMKKFTIVDSSGDIVLVGDISDFQDFDVTFTHSVNKTPVKEYYHIVEDHFNLYCGEFTSYGAGMSDGQDLDHTEIIHGDDGTIYLKMDEDFEVITYYVGTVADHRLTYGDYTIHLNDYIEAKNPGVLKIQRVSLLDVFRYKVDNTGQRRTNE